MSLRTTVLSSFAEAAAAGEAPSGGSGNEGRGAGAPALGGVAGANVREPSAAGGEMPAQPGAGGEAGAPVVVVPPPPLLLFDINTPGSGLYSLWISGDDEFTVFSYPFTTQPQVSE